MCALEGKRWSRRCEKRGENKRRRGRWRGGIGGEEEERKRTKERWGEKRKVKVGNVTRKESDGGEEESKMEERKI